MAEHYHSARRLSVLVMVSLVLLIGALPFRSTLAGPITLTGSISNLNASVTFQQIGRQLKVTLINTSTAGVLAPPDVLTAVFFSIFSIAGDPIPILKPASAVVPKGNTLLYFKVNGSSKKGPVVVGGEWAYRNALSGIPDHADEGISSSAFISTLFGTGKYFPGPHRKGPTSLDGVDIEYGLVGTNGVSPSSDNFDVTGDNTLIKNTVVFKLNGLPKHWVLQTDSIADVSFQYGNTLVDPNVPAKVIPEPSSFALAGVGVLLAASLVRKRR